MVCVNFCKYFEYFKKIQNNFMVISCLTLIFYIIEICQEKSHALAWRYELTEKLK